MFGIKVDGIPGFLGEDFEFLVCAGLPFGALFFFKFKEKTFVAAGGDHALALLGGTQAGCFERFLQLL
jgi:hypothetical protein